MVEREAVSLLQDCNAISSLEQGWDKGNGSSAEVLIEGAENGLRGVYDIDELYKKIIKNSLKPNEILCY